MHDEEFETAVKEIATRMWQHPRVRVWCAAWGIDYPEFLADRMEIARTARDAGGPWIDALDF